MRWRGRCRCKLKEFRVSLLVLLFRGVRQTVIVATVLLMLFRLTMLNKMLVRIWEDKTAWEDEERRIRAGRRTARGAGAGWGMLIYVVVVVMMTTRKADDVDESSKCWWRS